MTAPTPPLLLNTDFVQSQFTSLVQARAAIGQEIRIDDILAGDLYHGRATDGASTAEAVWEIVRIYREVDGRVNRLRYSETPLAWDDRANPANWP